MIIRTNGQKTIKLTFTDNVYTYQDKEDNRKYYNINPPYVSCSNKQDAERIQQEVNNLINKLTEDLLK